MPTLRCGIGLVRYGAMARPSKPALPNINAMDDDAFMEHINGLVRMPESQRAKYMERANKMRKHYEDALRKILNMGAGDAEPTEQHF